MTVLRPSLPPDSSIMTRTRRSGPAWDDALAVLKKIRGTISPAPTAVSDCLMNCFLLVVIYLSSIHLVFRQAQDQVDQPAHKFIDRVGIDDEWDSCPIVICLQVIGQRLDGIGADLK